MPSFKKSQVSALNSHTGYWLRMVSNQVSQSFARKLETSGVTVAEWVVLREMYDKDGTTAPSAVAQLTGLSRGAVSKLVDRLLQKKLVTRTESSVDRRYQDIQLTAEGMQLVPKLARIADSNDEAYFSALEPEEHEQLQCLLRKIAKHHKLQEPPIH